MNRRWRGQDGQQQEETTFVDIEAWGRTAELVGQYLTKGRGAMIEGRLKLDTWEDRESGQKRNRLKVVADQVTFLDRGDNNGGGQGGQGGGYHGNQGSQNRGNQGGQDDGGYSQPAAPQAPQSGFDDDEPPF